MKFYHPDQNKSEGLLATLPSTGGFELVRRLFAFPSLTLRRVILVIVLALGMAATQGAGLGLLLPAAQFIEDPNAAEPSGAVWEVVDRSLSTIGVSYSMAVLFIAIFLMVVAAQILFYVYTRVSISFINHLVRDIRSAAFSGILYAQMPFHFRHSASNLTSTLIQDGNRAESALMAMGEMLIHSIMFALYAALLVWISWETALIALAVMSITIVVTQAWLQGSRHTGEAISGLFHQMEGFGTERIQGIREVKLAGKEQADSDRLGTIAGELASANAKLSYRAAQIRIISDPIMVSSGLLVIYLGSSFVGLTLAELAVFVFALLRINPEVRVLNSARYRVSGHMNSLRGLLQIIDSAHQQSEEKDSSVPSPTTRTHPFTSLSNGIVFEKVTFSYETGSPVLAGINLTVEAGQTTAIVGPSGAGKSTLLALLVRLLNPTSGRILLDSTPIDEFRLPSLRKGIGLVSQDSAIFNDTVLNNIRFGHPSATIEQVESAGRLANAHGFIQELAKGYDTVVGDRGIALSVGQRQRLALARALLLDPSVLMLDEITSAQDPASEQALQEAIWRASNDRTVLIVTHRLSSIRGVDRVLVLQDGMFVEDGPPEELLRANGLFRHYYDIQIGSGWTESQAEAT